MKSSVTKFFLSIVFIFSFTGCSSKQANELIYELAQPPSESKCQFKRPEERDLCLNNARNRIPYEQYKKEREEIINGSK
jgi:hypothetical protein